MYRVESITHETEYSFTRGDLSIPQEKLIILVGNGKHTYQLESEFMDRKKTRKFIGRYIEDIFETSELHPLVEELNKVFNDPDLEEFDIICLRDIKFVYMTPNRYL